MNCMERTWKPWETVSGSIKTTPILDLLHKGVNLSKQMWPEVSTIELSVWIQYRLEYVSFAFSSLTPSRRTSTRVVITFI